MKREDAEKRAIREERAKWRLPLGLAVCVLLLIITGMLGLRLDFLREALHLVSDPIEQGMKVCRFGSMTITKAGVRCSR